MLPEDPGLSEQLMAVEGPMAREVKDLRLAYEILSGRDPRDSDSVDVALYGPKAAKKATLVTDLPGIELPQATREAVRKAASVLADAGWEISESQPPELERVHEIWAYHLSMDFQPQLADLSLIMSPAAIRLIELICEQFPPAAVRLADIHAERNRLSRLWTKFFDESPLIVGPTWTDTQFTHDADLDGRAGMEITTNRLRFISPANVLGLPSVAVPTGVHEGLPTGVQVYAERWREDLALDGAEAIKTGLGQICPIDPAF